MSNLVAHVLDVRLLQLASRTGCTYTRYADDMTFSTNKKTFPSKIAKATGGQSHSWIVGNEFKKIIQKSGFQLNESKTRMQYRNGRQDVTGLVVNHKVNVSKTYRSTVRAMVHNLRRNGTFQLPHPEGKGSTGQSDQLQGMLAYVNQVELYNRKIYKLSNPPYPTYSGRERLFRSFLYFNVFFNATKPVVVCEGKTDNVYLTQAIHALVASFPELANKDANGKTKLNIRILKYFENLTGSVLRLYGGSGNLKNLLIDYISHSTTKFDVPVSSHPIILLVDNDDGAKEIYSAAAKISGAKVTGNEKFIYVSKNLYIVPTPKKANGADSNIEDFFDAATLRMQVNGKILDQSKGKDTNTNFGKVVFAYTVVQKNAEKIDFNNFKPILSNLVATIKDYTKKYSAAPKAQATANT